MPELPEVHTITKDLNKYAAGYTIKRAVIAKKYNVLPDNNTFVESVEEKTIGGAERIAKNILLRLEGNKYIRFHLAMSGKLLLREPEVKDDKWVRLVLLLERYSTQKNLLFSDMRMFGKVELLDERGREMLKESIGLNVLDETLTPAKFLAKLKSKRTNVKNALLDQHLFAGLGNIYATDALFEAGIHPETKTAEINSEKATKLLSGIQKILQQGIENRGATLPDKMYVDLFGKGGTQQEHFRVYMRKRCKVCASPIQYYKLNGRGTYSCPTCQPKAGQKELVQIEPE
jgi:formamidopyrimidine-DNA glycosylase